MYCVVLFALVFVSFTVSVYLVGLLCLLVVCVRFYLRVGDFALCVVVYLFSLFFVFCIVVDFICICSLIWFVVCGVWVSLIVVVMTLSVVCCLLFVFALFCFICCYFVLFGDLLIVLLWNFCEVFDMLYVYLFVVFVCFLDTFDSDCFDVL